MSDQFEQSKMFRIPIRVRDYIVYVNARRLGIDTGRDVYLRVGNQLKQIVDQMKNVRHGS